MIQNFIYGVENPPRFHEYFLENSRLLQSPDQFSCQYCPFTMPRILVKNYLRYEQTHNESETRLSFKGNFRYIFNRKRCIYETFYFHKILFKFAYTLFKLTFGFKLFLFFKNVLRIQNAILISTFCICSFLIKLLIIIF